MAKSSNYRVQLRRRREGKTDYQARKALVISGKPRLVTRPSNRNFSVQIVVAKPHGDEVLAAASSHELSKTYGWRGPTGNISAAYLTGLVCGLKAKTAGVEEAILDIGLISPTKGAKVFAALSGVVDAGVDVPHSEDKIVKERLKGEHIAKYAKSLGIGSDEYIAKFSRYLEKGIAPEKLPEHFNKVKGDIITVSKGGKITIETPQKIVLVRKPAPAPAEKNVPEKAPEAAQEQAPKAILEKAPAKAPEKPEVAEVKEAPAKKPAAKKPAAKKEAVEEKKKPAKEETKEAATIVEDEKAPAKKAAKPKAEKVEPKKKPAAKKAPAKETPKEKPSKKGEKKA